MANGVLITKKAILFEGFGSIHGIEPTHEESLRTVFGEHYTLMDRIDQLPQMMVG